MAKVTDEQIREALLASGGVIAHAAEKLGVSRGAISVRVNVNQSLIEARQEAQQAILDAAETELFKAVRAGKSWAVRFVLGRLGRGRGYGAKMEVDATLGVGEIAILRLPDNGRDGPDKAVHRPESGASE